MSTTLRPKRFIGNFLWGGADREAPPIKKADLTGSAFLIGKYLN
jgi:hypothetical protein